MPPPAMAGVVPLTTPRLPATPAVPSINRRPTSSPLQVMSPALATPFSELDDDHAADRFGCGTGVYLHYAASAHRLAEVGLRRRTGNDHFRLDLPAGRVQRSRPAAKVCACRTTAAPSWCWRWQRSTRVACAIPSDRGGWVMPTCQCRMYWKRIARRWLGLGELHDPD